MATITLSLISHTNVGKTTLARTLLRRDVGDIRDAAHVTDAATGYTLIESPAGDALRLWDTPGFGDSARLLQAAAPERQPDRLVPDADLGPLRRPAVLQQPAGGAQRPRRGRRRALPRQCGGGPGGRRLRRPRDADPRLDGEAGAGAPQPARSAAPGRAGSAPTSSAGPRIWPGTRGCATRWRSTPSRAAGSRSTRCSSASAPRCPRAPASRSDASPPPGARAMRRCSGARSTCSRANSPRWRPTASGRDPEARRDGQGLAGRPGRRRTRRLPASTRRCRRSPAAPMRASAPPPTG